MLKDKVAGREGAVKPVENQLDSFSKTVKQILQVKKDELEEQEKLFKEQKQQRKKPRK